jgi:hypothetical protein
VGVLEQRRRCVCVCVCVCVCACARAHAMVVGVGKAHQQLALRPACARWHETDDSLLRVRTPLARDTITSSSLSSSWGQGSWRLPWLPFPSPPRGLQSLAAQPA